MERTPGDNNRPEHERLEPWEIDLTGSTEQDDSLRDVIGDAIHEATATGGEIPDWGARTIARALANRLPDATSALHTLAVTGTGDQARLSAELADLYDSGDAEVREWVNWLGTYLINQHREPGSAEPDAPLTGTALEKVSHYLRHAFAEADRHGTAISEDDARAVASLLAPVAGPGSAMRQFADTGSADQELLRTECQQLQAHNWHTPDATEWLRRLNQHLAAASSTSSPEQELPEQAAAGLREHGDAFRAYLRLPDIQAGRDDLVEAFHEFYVGSFPTMDALLDQLTEVRDWEHALDDLAGQWGIDGLVSLDRRKVERVARETWDIVELNGHFYAFDK